jgi:hypothetical protein
MQFYPHTYTLTVPVCPMYWPTRSARVAWMVCPCGGSEVVDGVVE